MRMKLPADDEPMVRSRSKWRWLKVTVVAVVALLIALFTIYYFFPYIFPHPNKVYTSNTGGYYTNRIVVSFSQTMTLQDVEVLVSSFDGEIDDYLELSGEIRLVHIILPSGMTTDEAVDLLEKDNRVKGADRAYFTSLRVF